MCTPPFDHPTHTHLSADAREIRTVSHARKLAPKNSVSCVHTARFSLVDDKSASRWHHTHTHTHTTAVRDRVAVHNFPIDFDYLTVSFTFNLNHVSSSPRNVCSRQNALRARALNWGLRAGRNCTTTSYTATHSQEMSARS